MQKENVEPQKLQMHQGALPCFSQLEVPRSHGVLLDLTFGTILGPPGNDFQALLPSEMQTDTEPALIPLLSWV